MRFSLKTFFFILALSVFGVFVYRTYQFIDLSVVASHPGLLFAACFFQFINVLTQFQVWKSLSRDHTPQQSGKEFYKIYAFGSVSRYLPVGKIAQLGALIFSTPPIHRAGVLVTFIEWTLSGVLSGVFLMILAVIPINSTLFEVYAGFYLLLIGLVFIPNWEKRRLPNWVLLVLKKLGKGAEPDIEVHLSRKRILKATLTMFLFSWVAEAVTGFFLFSAIAGTPSVLQTARMIFSSTVSYFGGMIAFFIPNGLGVREAIFVWATLDEFGQEVSQFLPVALRSTVLFCEILFFLPLLFLWRKPEELLKNHASTKDEVSRLYKTWTAEDSYPHFLDQEYKSILQSSPKLSQPGQKVLDVGCGVGRVAVQLKELGHTVHGLDLVQECIDEALKKSRIDEGFVTDALNTGLPSGSYDVVLFYGVLLHIYDVNGVLKEAHRLLKPGGEVVIFDHHSRNPYVKLHFNRPDWFDRVLEGRSNAPRRPLNEILIEKSSPAEILWNKPIFFSIFTQHPHRLIQLVHNLARAFFRMIRIFTQSPWTGNMVFLVGKKKG